MKTLGRLGEPGSFGLATDLYQLTMAAAYFEAGMEPVHATFELFVRRLPPHRGYLLTAGLAQALEYLEALKFDGSSIDYLRRLPQFGAVGERFWEYLRGFRFTGSVAAMPEGTVAFADEPLLQVSGPMIEGQLIETFLLATINHQTLIATKAARVVDAAGGKGIIEFGARRAHGFESSLFGARAAVIGGCIGTSNLLAGELFDIPVYGTAAHSFTMAFEQEADAFASFFRTFPRTSIMLIDTYDTLEGARRAASLDPGLQGVRLDSGDVIGLSFQVRKILDEAGLPDAIVVASGDLNEHSIQRATEAGAPIDLYGVGTEMIVSRDAPALSGVYKLVAIEQNGHRPVRKLSPEKSTYPDVKQVFRNSNSAGRFVEDVIGLRAEAVAGEPLLEPVIEAGKRCGELPGVWDIQKRAASQRRALPEGVRRLQEPDVYPVAISNGIRDVIRKMNDES